MSLLILAIIVVGSTHDRIKELEESLDDRVAHILSRIVQLEERIDEAEEENADFYLLEKFENLEDYLNIEEVDEKEKPKFHYKKK